MPQPAEITWLIYGLILLTALSGAIADIFIYNWAKTGVTGWMIAACLTSG